jgi:hypothetical protein
MLAQMSTGSTRNLPLATVINSLADMFVLLENQRITAEVAQSAVY